MENYYLIGLGAWIVLSLVFFWANKPQEDEVGVINGGKYVFEQLLMSFALAFALVLILAIGELTIN